MSESAAGPGQGGATVAIDERRCEAMGFCIQVAPTVFDLVDGRPPVNAVDRVLTDDELELAIEAEQVCPTQAIQVRE